MVQHLRLRPRITQWFVSDFRIFGNVDRDETRGRFAANSIERRAVGLDVSFGQRKQIRFPRAAPGEVPRFVVVFFERLFPRGEADFCV